MADVVLHEWDISPFCRKVRKALRLKGISYRSVEYNGMRAPQSARLASSRQLPVLDWDGDRVADSSLICEFLDQQVPMPTLYPAERRGQGNRTAMRGSTVLGAACGRPAVPAQPEQTAEGPRLWRLGQR